MKLKLIFVSMFALAALASCSNDDEGVTNLPADQSPAEAYLALTIKTPQPAFGGTRAGDATLDGAPGDKEGNESESSVTDALVVGLLADKSIEVYTWAGTQKTGTYEYTGDAIGVSSSLDSIFVVVNPSALARQQIVAAHKTSSRELVFRAIKEEVGNISGEKKFMMTSEGSLTNGAWTGAKVKKVTTTSDAAKNEAKGDQTLVNVDRVVAKATLSSQTPTFENGTGKLLGFQLNTTNKNYLPYADLISYKLADGNASTAKYRKDDNWSILAMQWGKDKDGHKIIQGAASEAFNWLNNITDDVDGKWLGYKNSAYTEASSYCHENTMEAVQASNAQDYNNTTKMVIKAKYTPTKNGLNEGNSWFRVDGVVMTFAELDASYKDASATDKLKYSAFLDKLLGAERTKGWTDEKATAVSLADLEAVTNGGYKAATVDSITVDGKKVNAYLIEFFQNSNNYYDVNIKHDNRVSPRQLGRWGMVRNNWYTLTVNKISNAGKPYIPDPTDPAITDPTNPKPDKPTPDDDDAFIAVTITVNNWTTWSQGVDL